MEGTPQTPTHPGAITGHPFYIGVYVRPNQPSHPAPAAEIATDANAEWIGRGIAAILVEATNRGLDAVEIQSAMMQGFQAATQ